MSYEPTVWRDGDLITADKMNKMENGIRDNQGADGTAATITVGEVVTGEPDTEASVENTGNESAAVLKFTIPIGEKGGGVKQVAPFSDISEAPTQENFNNLLQALRNAGILAVSE